MQVQAAKIQAIHESGSEKHFPDHIFRVMLTYLQDNPIICDRRSLGAGNKNQTSDLKLNTPTGSLCSFKMCTGHCARLKDSELVEFGD